MKHNAYNALGALGNLDDDILDLAEESRGASYRSKPKRTARTLILRRVLPIAACLCLLLTSSLVIGSIANAPKAFDPHDHTTWEDRSNVITIEQCESIYLYDTFEEIVEKIGRPYEETWHHFEYPSCEYDHHSMFQIATWIVDNGAILEIIFYPEHPDASIEEAPFYYPRQSLDIDLTTLIYDEHYYQDEKYDAEYGPWHYASKFWLNEPSASATDREIQAGIRAPYILGYVEGDTELFDTIQDTVSNDADLWVAEQVHLKIHPSVNCADLFKQIVYASESQFYAEHPLYESPAAPSKEIETAN